MTSHFLLIIQCFYVDIFIFQFYEMRSHIELSIFPVALSAKISGRKENGSNYQPEILVVQKK